MLILTLYWIDWWIENNLYFDRGKQGHGHQRWPESPFWAGEAKYQNGQAYFLPWEVKKCIKKYLYIPNSFTRTQTLEIKAILFFLTTVYIFNIRFYELTNEKQWHISLQQGIQYWPPGSGSAAEHPWKRTGRNPRRLPEHPVGCWKAGN